MSGAVSALHRLTDLPGGEAKWLHDLLVRSINGGRPDRLHLETLSEPDIVCYLPAEHFVPGKTWEELKREWRKSAPGRATDLKKFVAARYAARIKEVERAATKALPSPEIERLGMRLHEISAFSQIGLNCSR